MQLSALFLTFATFLLPTRKTKTVHADGAFNAIFSFDNFFLTFLRWKFYCIFLHHSVSVVFTTERVFLRNIIRRETKG